MQNTKKKICIVIGSLDLGGAEMHLTRTLPLINPSHFDFEIFAMARRGVLADKLEAEGVRVISPWIKSDGTKKNIFRRFYP